MLPTITFDEANNLFLIRMATSVYAMRIDAVGRLLHVTHTPAREPVEALALLDRYEEPNFGWDIQGTRYELLTHGEVNLHETALQVRFPQPPGPLGAGEAAHVPVDDLRLVYHRHSISKTPEPALSVQRESLRDVLSIVMKDAAYDFFVTLNYRVTPEHDILERWLTAENRTGMPVSIDSLAFGQAHFPTGAALEILHGAGGWAREFLVERTPLKQGVFTLAQRGLNTGHASNPAYIVVEPKSTTEAAGPAYFGALAYSGNWALRFERVTTGAARVIGGYEPGSTSITLQPDEAHTTPAFVLGVCDDGVGGASQRLHAFTQQHVLPPGPDERPVLYNSWEATYFDLNFDGQLELAKRAATIGVELFCLDDGWFGARRNDKAGLGDWFVSMDAFPEGLRPLADEVRKLGMQFGLWVEPEMVNADSDLYRAHPDWVLHWPGRPRREERNQLLLDFGRPEVVAYIYERLDALVREIGVDFFKWDFNRAVSDPGSAAGKNLYRRHVEAFYGLLDRLRKTHPKLAIQTCSGGGGRIDFGVLQRTDQAWVSDNTDAHDRTFIEDGYSLFYPPRTMESWVTHERNHQTGRESSLGQRFDVAMRGVLGIGSALNRLPQTELDEYAKRIAFYKRIRKTVHTGRLHRLETADRGGVSIWQVNALDGSSVVYSHVVVGQFQGFHIATPKFRDLPAGAMYAATDWTGADLGRFSSAQLQTLGLPGDTRWGGSGCAIRSRTVLLTRV
ncbi:MAG: alpha-galactosidase [Tepidisphaeraceae bacterium]